MTYGNDEYLAEHDATNTAKRVTLATQVAGEDLTNDVLKVEERFSYQSFTSNSTLAIKSGAGFLHTMINGAISSPTIALYDNTTGSGTLIGIIAPDSPRQTYLYDISFATGLTVSTTPGVSPNLTISYR